MKNEEKEKIRKNKNFCSIFVRSNEAQIHILETVIGGLFLLAAIMAAINIAPNTTQQDSGLGQLELLGNDALRSLANLPPEKANASRYHNSTLTYYSVTQQVENLTKFFNASFEVTVSYAFSLYNYSSGEGRELVFSYYTSLPILSDSVSCHRLVTYKEMVYDFRLLLWFEPREVSS